MTEGRDMSAEDIGRTDYIAMTESFPGYWARSEDGAFDAVLELIKLNSNVLEKAIRIIQIESPKREGVAPYIDEMGGLTYQTGAQTWKVEGIKIKGLPVLIDQLKEKCDDLDGVRWA